MGVLGKLEHALEGSGVSVAIEIGAMDLATQGLQVQVLLSAKHAAQVVTDVSLSLVHRETIEERKPGIGETERTEGQTLLTLSNPGPVKLQPGGQVAVPFQLALASMIAGGMGEFLGALQGGREISGGYYLHVRATVEGHHLHAQATQILQPDMAGGGYKL